MKNCAFLPLAGVLLFSAAARAADCKWFNDNYYHFSICVPGDWKKSYREEGDRHHLTFRRGTAGTEITVTASPAEGVENHDGNDSKKRTPGGAGKGFRKIIETKELAAGDNVTVKVLVFDYYQRGVRMLQRSMLSRYGGSTLAVECRAPIRSFARYTDVFNEVMSSVDYTGNTAGEAVDESGGEKSPARKEAGPQKPAAPKRKADTKKAPATVKRREPAREVQPVAPRDDAEESFPLKNGKGKGAAADKESKKLKPDTSPESKDDATAGEVKGKGENEYLDLESVEDPEARKIIESELNILQNMERRGLIEKVEEDR